jgi:hypothetical protein
MKTILASGIRTIYYDEWRDYPTSVELAAACGASVIKLTS